MGLLSHRGLRGLAIGLGLGALAALLVLALPRRPGLWVPVGPNGSPDYATARSRMVDRLVDEYSLRYDRVIEAMRKVERHLFVPERLRSAAYLDTPLPIGEDQTISAPGVVAKMTELLEPEPHHVVLEVGTGSGYQAAVLAVIVDHVYSIEIVPPLAASAEARLRDLGYSNVTVRCGDGYKGWPEHAPFDGIIVTCAPDKVPEPLKEQLKEGGRMVIPVGGDVGPQWLHLLTKRGGALVDEVTLPVRFVPMTGEALKGGR